MENFWTIFQKSPKFGPFSKKVQIRTKSPIFGPDGGSGPESLHPAGNMKKHRRSHTGEKPFHVAWVGGEGGPYTDMNVPSLKI